MSATSNRELGRVRRHRRIRKKLSGCAERPRLCVYRSHNHLYAQVIDDTQGITLIGRSTKDKRLNLSNGGTTAAAAELGKLVASEAQEKGVQVVVFDRGGYLYHGRVKAFAEAVRAAGVKV